MRRFALLICVAVLAPCASALAQHSSATPEQVAWVRRAATNFVAAELSGNGAGACGILIAQLRATEHHRSCAERWNAKLAKLLARPGEPALLRAQQHAIASAAVVVHGNSAWLHLKSPLTHGPNRFEWTENCWMLRG